MFRLGEVLEWLPNRSTQQKRHRNKLLFRVDSEIPPIHQIRLKVEINCFEHFNVLGLQEVPFREKYIEFVTDRAPSYSLLKAVSAGIASRINFSSCNRCS